ncbi:flagellar basal body M-ring protein FliF, partial [bacterium]|nr:flagellar basal body M-ring protein FliF [bacterium]
VRSEQPRDVRQAGGAGGGAAGVPGALTNQPPATGQTDGEVGGGAAGADGGGAQGTLRSEATRNFEVDRTISHTRNQVGKVRRLTVAVAVDDMLVPPAEDAGEDAKAGKQAWSEAELERLTVLVRNAVGFDVARGDDVTVINTPFMAEKEEILPLPETPIWEQGWFAGVLNKVLGALAFLLLIFLVLRPAIRQLTSNAKRIKELETQQAMTVAALKAAEDESGDGTVTLTGSSSRPLLGADGSAIDKKLETVRSMVGDNPERVAQVVKGWAGDE